MSSLEVSNIPSTIGQSFEKDGSPPFGGDNTVNGGDNIEKPSTAAEEPTTKSQCSESRRSQRRCGLVQLLVLFHTLFLAGWNDGTLGPLLPRIQSTYRLGFIPLSLIFILTCLGFITGGVLNIFLDRRFGFGKVISLGSILQTVACTIQALAPPYPLFVIAAFINGVGLSLQDAHANAFVASSRDHSSIKMSIMQAIYGIGAFAAPFVSTQFSHLPDKHWLLHYAVTAGLSAINFVALILIFRLKTQDECLVEAGQLRDHVEPMDREDQQMNPYKEVFRLKSVHSLSIFLFCYVGAEVTTGSWIVTYIIDARHGPPRSSGYIAGGFFGGLTLGRVVLIWVTHKIGEGRAVYVYTILALGLELIIWLVPSWLGGAICVAFVGVVFGPVYPIVMNHAGRIIPPRLLTGCIGWIASAGTIGSAVVPFVLAAITSHAGIQSLQPVLVVMISAMIILWILVPKHPALTSRQM